MAKTKAVINLAVTAKLICAFVLAYVICRFSHDMAQMVWATFLCKIRETCK